tara:strand:- start:784 stop:888 length:105 start_codon:yes stop_codon:yes gene_type:complete
MKGFLRKLWREIKSNNAKRRGATRKTKKGEKKER